MARWPISCRDGPWQEAWHWWPLPDCSPHRYKRGRAWAPCMVTTATMRSLSCCLLLALALISPHATAARKLRAAWGQCPAGGLPALTVLHCAIPGVQGDRMRGCTPWLVPCCAVPSLGCSEWSRGCLLLLCHAVPSSATLCHPWGAVCMAEEVACFRCAKLCHPSTQCLWPRGCMLLLCHAVPSSAIPECSMCD